MFAAKVTMSFDFVGVARIPTAVPFGLGHVLGRVQPVLAEMLQGTPVEGWTAGWDWDVIRWGNVPPMNDSNASDCAPWFGSVHQGGCLFTFGDGSVHTINYSIDGALFQSLSHCSDDAPQGFSE